MNVTIRKIGNSEGVILPKELLERLNLKSGDVLNVLEDEEGLTLKPVDEAFERQMRAAQEIMDHYKVALQKLAE
ncbi:AbrB/MazE/SpoVT family DNA-binding domain-containing protein [Nitratireductor sp. GCM10026969]|uniref:AbrB/MazE/SpoVT family DNA-binding domain-containing protein n=1 Tax=Nitratireductor sp. GCM10026969 TaxID=3252645 RepID=UPI0036069FAF